MVFTQLENSLAAINQLLTVIAVLAAVQAVLLLALVVVVALRKG